MRAWVVLLILFAGDVAENAVTNGDFHAWKSYAGKGVTTTSVGTPPESLPDGWYGGPGVGATATYDVVDFAPDQADVPGHPKRHLRITWHTPPSKDWPGETHHQPDFRGTFLEYFGVQDVNRFAGKTVRFTFYARVAKDTMDVVPILWYSYGANRPTAPVKGQDYELFESSGKPGVVAVAQGKPRPEAVCRVTTKWQRFEKLVTLPKTDGKLITPGHYTGVGFDYAERGAPTLDLACIRVEERPTPE